MQINFHNFFRSYIVDPLAPELTTKQKVIAFIGSLILFPLTIAIYCWKNHKATYIKPNRERHDQFNQLVNSINKVAIKEIHSRHHVQEIPIKIEEMSRIVNNKFIRDHYSQPLPAKDEVTVPVLDPSTKAVVYDFETGKPSEVAWTNLTVNQKIDVINKFGHPHDQLNLDYLKNRYRENEINKFVDKRFFTEEGQTPFIEGDPRKHHGNDHCSRAVIFAAVFAYLYQKYHPNHHVNTEDIILSQLAAAGHDSGRQTEGPDVYDEESANLTVDQVRSMGVYDVVLLREIHHAIMDKDAKPTGQKGLITKCVQNADSAEYARLVHKPSSKKEFEKSRNYLDIYKELSALAFDLNPTNPGAANLKKGLTFQDFCTELDLIRKDINDFIIHTRTKDFREHAVKSTNYYQTFLDCINSNEFPFLNHIVQKIGMKPHKGSIETIQKKRDKEYGLKWIRYGLHKISTPSLEKMLQRFTENKEREIVQKIEIEINKRIQKATAFEKECDAKKVDVRELIRTYAHLPQILKNEYRERFLERITKKDPDPLKLINKAVKSTISHKPLLRLAVLDLTHETFKKEFSAIELSGDMTLEDARTLEKKADKLLDCYQNADKALRDPETLTSVALAYSKVAEIYIDNGKSEDAQELLNHSAREIKLEKSNPFYNLKKLFNGQPEDASMYLPADCRFLCGRKMRICQKLTKKSELEPPEKFYEFSFELPSKEREKLNKILTLIPEGQKKTVPSTFLKKTGTVFNESEFATININETIKATDLEIDLDPDIKVFLGNNALFNNQYHMMRLRMPAHISPRKVQEILSKLGLSMVMMPSRPEDVKREMLARSLNLRLPQIYNANPMRKMTAEKVYDNLSDSQQALIDHDREHAKVALVGNDHYELVQPQIGDEAWSLGVRAVGTFIKGGKDGVFTEAAEIIKAILKKGVMSSEERNLNGILGTGCAPAYNNMTGSGNQVFGRILSKHLFTNKFRMEKFPVNGNILILMKPQVLERMPYTYLTDRGGIRNPKFASKNHQPEHGFKTPLFLGKEIIPERLGFAETIQELSKKPFPLNETMFNYNIGSSYIQKLVVYSESERDQLITILQKGGILHIGGVPVEEMVIASKTLNPNMIDQFDEEENPSLKEREEDLRYINVSIKPFK